MTNLQLKKEVDVLEKKISALKRNKKELIKSQERLCKVWRKMGPMLDKAAYDRTRERERQKEVMREVQSIF